VAKVAEGTAGLKDSNGVLPVFFYAIYLYNVFIVSTPSVLVPAYERLALRDKMTRHLDSIPYVWAGEAALVMAWHRTNASVCGVLACGDHAIFWCCCVSFYRWHGRK